jgi:hypothetical protein
MDPIKDYYEYLKKAGADVAPSVDSFRNTLNNADTAKQYYSYLRTNKFDAPDTFESFSKTLGVGKKKDGTTVSPVSQSQSPLLSQVPDKLPLGIPGQPSSADIFTQEVEKSKAKVKSVIEGSNDIYSRVIKEDRLNIFDNQLRSTPSLDGFVNPAAQSVKRDIVKTIPVTQEEISIKKQEVIQDPAKSKDILRRAAKKDSDVLKSAYLIDSEDRIAKDPTRANLVIENAEKIARGELTYDINKGRLQKPEGILISAVRGNQERNRQLDDFKFFTETLNRDAIISQLEADMKDFDPDRPVPVPEGASAQFSNMLGSEGIAIAKSAGAGVLTSLIPGAQAAAPFVAAFAASPEYYKRGYSSALRQAYYEQRQKGVPESEALDVAQKQAEAEANYSAAEGAASGLLGARVGMKPSSLKLGGGFKNAVSNVATSTGNFIKENIPEGLADATAAGGLQIAKNVEAINNGLDRNLFDGVQDNVAGELGFTIGMGILTKAGKFAINPKSLNTIVTGIAQQPKETVDAKLGEMIVNGQVTPKEAVEANKKIEAARSVNSQIPKEITDEETRADIADRIRVREELKNELATANEVFHADIKDKIKNVDQEILNIVNSSRGATVESQATEAGSNIISPRQLTGPELSITERAPAGKRLFNDPNQQATEIEKAFKASKGINTPEPAPITKLDENKSKTIADAYEAMQDNPNDPEVQKAYEAMANETVDQYRAMADAGIRLEIWQGKGEPYKNSAEMIADVRDNKHMYIFSTEEGFGETTITDEQREQNALLRDSGFKDVNGRPLLVNDVFRGVHDFFGHTKLGNSFGAVGEENAWNVHSRMYSPLARRAMTTETRGQNSWVNFNGNMRNPDGSIKKKGDAGFIPVEKRPFAEQKMGLLPEEFSNIEDNYSLKTATIEEVQATTDPTGFADQADKAKASQGNNSITMAPYTQAEFDQMAKDGAVFFKTKDNMAVGAVKANGEIISLVKNFTSGFKGASQAIIAKMKDMGGLFIENYDGYLTKQYEKAGYKVVARIPFDETQAQEGWDKPGSPIRNKPDVVFMVRKDLAPDKEQSFQDYNSAKAFTQGLVDKAVADGVAKLPTQISIDNIANELLGELSNPIDTALKATIPNVAQSLEKLGLKIKVVDGNVDTEGARAARGNQGLFISEDGTIIIDKSKLQNEVEAGLVVWHEASHPVMNMIRNKKRELYDAIVRGLNEAAGNNSGLTKAQKWAKENYSKKKLSQRYGREVSEEEAADVQNDEAIVETIARINSGLIDVANLDTGLRQKLIDFVNSVAKFFSIDPILNDTDLAAFKKTVSQVADALKTGRDISEIVGEENVKEFQATSDQAQAEGLFKKKDNKRFESLAEVAKYVEEWANKNRLFDKSIEDVSDEEVVKKFADHVSKEIKAWESSNKEYIGFYDEDIPNRLNPELQKFAEVRYGRKLNAQEVSLYHIVSAFASPSADPVFDSSKGLEVFDLFMKQYAQDKSTARPSGYTNEQATIWDTINGKRVDTGKPKFDEQGNPVMKQVAKAYAIDSLDKMNKVIDYFNGDFKKAVDWLESVHSYEDLSAVLGLPTKGPKALTEHEYLTKSGGGFGVFAITGPKLGSYILNRVGEYSTITKDMWYARTMARLAGENVVDGEGNVVKTPWATTKAGVRKRKLADEAFRVVAKKLGTTPADVQQKIWDFEKRLYEKLGAAEKTGYASEGFMKKAKELEPSFKNEQASVGNRDIINGFYSPIEDRINTFKQPKASVQKWKEIVGVKSDEAVFSGLADWLGGMKPDRQLSKEEVRQFIKDNRIEINEVVKGKGGMMSQSQMDDVYNGVREQLSNMDMVEDVDSVKDNPLDVWYNNPTDDNYDQLGDFLEERGIDLNFISDAENDGTKFSQYQLPGGENYKEVLITLPSEVSKLRVEFNQKYPNWGAKPFEEVFSKEDADRFQKALGKKEFKSSHFEEGNIITHLRMNTRTDADGKKVLFLEEVQSDWGQKGKKEGFIGSPKLQEDLKKEGYRYSPKNSGQLLDINTGKEVSKWTVNDKASKIFDKLRSLETPSAPYVTNTNAWVKLGLKVALKEAVKQGADRIAWTTGDQQNERYDLRKQVDEIGYSYNPSSNSYRIVAGKGGDQRYNSEVNESELEGSFGKDVADKIVSNKDSSVGKMNFLRGQDLQVGGKGMKAFYGDANTPGIVGNVAKALVKELTGKEGGIVPSRLSSARNQDVIDRYNRARQYGNVPESLAKEYEQAGGLQSEQPAIDITPELAQSVQGGMPQFSVGNRSEEDLRAPGEGKERERALSSKFGDLDPETQAKIQDDAVTYFQRPNKQTEKAVSEFLDGLNIVDAADYVLGNPDIPEVSKVWMAAEVAKRLNTQIAAETDPAIKEALTDKQASIYNEFAKKATGLGQAVQAFIAFKNDPNAIEFFLPKILRQLKKQGLENVTEVQKAEIVNLLKEVNSAADGLPKDKAIIKLSHYLGKLAPMKPIDILQALWYAKILSGVTTQATNFFANVFNTAFELPAVGLRIAMKTGNPLAVVAGLKGFGSGVAKGAIAAADIMKSGVRSKEADKYFSESPLEYFTWSKWLGKKGQVLDNIPPLNFGAWKYIGRMLAATDAMFSTANQEAIANMLAYAEASGTPAGNNFKKANQILGNTKRNIMLAKAQARAEGFDLNTLQGKRRVIEIVFKSRGEKITSEAETIGKRITLNYDPEGWTRPLFDATVALQQKFPPIKMVIPFARIVANITENALNYTPFGLARAVTGAKNPFSGMANKLTGDERADLFAKFAIGMGAMALAATKMGEDEDDWFEITAGGSPDVQKRYELQKGGWRPYTITFKDGTKIPYKDWPIAGVLAGLGHIRDAKKYSFDDSTQSALYAYGFFLNFYDKSLLSGLQDFFGLFNVSAGRGKYAPESKASERAEKYAAQQVKSVAVSNLSQQLGRLYSELVTGDPQRDAKTFFEVIYKDIPIVNDGIRPIIDVFGEPVKYNTTERLKPIYTTESEEMIKWLNENKFFVGVPQRKNIYTADGSERPMTDDEYYEYRKIAGKETRDMIKEFMGGIKEPDRQISEKMFEASKDAARKIAYVTMLEKYGFK